MRNDKRPKESFRKSPPQLKLFKVRVNNAMARKVLELIELKKLSKNDFAKLVKKQPSIISRWLTGDHNFSIETICEISFYTRTPITEILDMNYLFRGYFSSPTFIELCERISR